MLEYFADLYDLTGDEKYKKYAKRTADKLISDSYEDKKEEVFTEHGTELTLQEW